MSLHEFQATELTLGPIRIGNAWYWEIDLVLRDDDTGEETPVDLTGAEAELQIRRIVSDPATLISLTHASGITLNGSKVSVALPSAQTELLKPAITSVTWGLRLKLPGGDWWTPVEGTVAVVLGVSR